LAGRARQTRPGIAVRVVWCLRRFLAGPEAEPIQGAFELSSQTKNKYFRGSWNQRTRLEIGFYAKGEEKAQIALQVSKLPKESDVERERAAWKAALLKLEDLLED
jgi:hypothetical protein